MGLSDEERESNLYWCCHKLHGLGMGLPAEGEGTLSHLRDLCLQVWPAFIGAHTNGMHWIFGSSAGNKVRDPDSPWSAAILLQLGKSMEREPRTRDTFDPFDGYLDIPGLLKQSGSDNHPDKVYEIFSWTESAVYSLRRYRDAFHRERKTLSDLIASIQGACYSIFCKHDVFARAYVLSETLGILYGSPWGDDIVRKILTEDHWHHHLSRPMSEYTSLADIRRWHWMASVAETPQERLLILMQIAGRRYHYRHSFLKLCRTLQKAHVRTDFSPLWEQIKKNHAEHESRETDQTKQYRDRSQAEAFMALHGYDSWDYEKECPRAFDEALFGGDPEGEEE